MQTLLIFSSMLIAVFFSACKKSSTGGTAPSETRSEIAADISAAGHQREIIPVETPPVVDEFPDLPEKMDIGLLYRRFDNSKDYEKLAGQSVAIEGTFSLIASDSSGYFVMLQNGHIGDEDFGEFKCYVSREKLFQKCFPGQQILVRGNIYLSDGFSFYPMLANCEVIATKGKPYDRFPPGSFESDKYLNSLQAIVEGHVASVSQLRNYPFFKVSIEAGPVLFFPARDDFEIRANEYVTVYGTQVSRRFQQIGSPGDLFDCVLIHKQ